MTLVMVILLLSNAISEIRPFRNIDRRAQGKQNKQPDNQRSYQQTESYLIW